MHNASFSVVYMKRGGVAKALYPSIYMCINVLVYTSHNIH